MRPCRPLLAALAAWAVLAAGGGRAAETPDGQSYATGADKTKAPPPAPAVPPAAAPAAYGPGPVYVLTLSDEESPGASLYGLFTEWNTAHLRRSLRRAEKAGASLFVIRLTTNGGLVNNAFRMSEALRKVQGMRTATLVVHRAISAGAFLSLSCDDIYMVPGSVIGDAYPISIIPGLKPKPPPEEGTEEPLPAAGSEKDKPKKPEPRGKPARSNEDKKQIGAIVAYIEAAAAQKGHSPALAGAMVDPDIEVLLVTRDGRREIVTRKDYELKHPPSAGPVAGETVEVVDSNEDILILRTEQALELGLAKAQSADLAEVLRREGLAGRPVVEIQLTLSEVLARFFSSGIVVMLLIAAAIFALYVELNHPSGVAAGFFLLALGLFFWANYMAGSANAISIILVLLGAALLAVEIFFFPGFGVAGIVGAVLVALGLILARVPADLFSSPGGGGGGGGGYELPGPGWGSQLVGASVPVLAGLGLGVIGVVVLMRFFPRVPFLSRLVLKADLAGAVVSAGQPVGVEDPEKLVGRLGTAATNLRPGGSARFDGKLLDVISDGEWLEAGTALKIVSADSNRVVVRRA